MEEDDLDIWFDEQKDILTKTYLQKINTDHASGKDTDKEGEKQYLVELEKIRRDYQKRYIKIKVKRARKALLKKIKTIVLFPFMMMYRVILFVGKPLWKGIKFLFFGTKKLFKAIKKWFSKTIIYAIKQYYAFHIRRRYWVVIWPMKWTYNRIARPMRRLIDFVKQFYKDAKKWIINTALLIWDKTIDYAKRSVAYVAEIFKKVFPYFVKAFKIISAIFHIVFAPILKPLAWLMALFKKKNDDDE